MNLRQARKRTAELLDAHARGDRPSQLVDYSLIALILANVAAVVLETVDTIGAAHARFFINLEIFSVAVFTVEYLLRLWSCPDEPSAIEKGLRPTRLRWMFSPMGLVDLMAILPFYIFLLIPDADVSLLLLRVFRALRLIRLFKLTRYSSAINVLGSVLKRESRVLGVVAFILAIILVMASWGMYLLEHNHQPDVFSSIPAAMWWAVVSLTTVGYGDVVPVTDGGRLFAGVIALVGIAMISLPAGIMASGFSTEVKRRSREYEAAVDSAVADGSLSARDREELETIKNELGLSDEDAQSIMHKVKRAAAPRYCPHCGKRV